MVCYNINVNIRLSSHLTKSQSQKFRKSAVKKKPQILKSCKKTQSPKRYLKNPGAKEECPGERLPLFAIPQQISSGEITARQRPVMCLYSPLSLLV
jgi:hypothetical protein